MAPAADLGRKAAALDARLAALGSVLIAYSGGIDSAFLAVAATKLLGPRALCITADSPSSPDRHRTLAIGTAHVSAPSRTDSDRRDVAARVPQQPNEPLLLLQARAVHAAHRDRARP